MAELVTRYDLDVIRRELETKIDMVRRELENGIDGLRRDLEGKIDTLSLRLTVRMGAMLAAGVAALAANRPCGGSAPPLHVLATRTGS